MKCVALAFVMLLSGVLHGGVARADGTPLTQSDCIRMGLENSARVWIARRDQDLAEASIDQARSLALPNLKAAATYTRLDQVTEFELDGQVVELGSLDNYSVETTVSQLLYSGGKVRAALRAGHVARERADLGRTRIEQALVRDIRVQFNAILLAAATITVREESLAQFKAFLEQTRARFENGTVSEFDVISAQVRVQNEEPKLVAARNRYQVACAVMQRLLGLDRPPDGFDGELDFSAWQPDLDALKVQALIRNPLLLEMQSLVDLRREDVIVARAKGRPELSANATYVGANSYRFAAFQDSWEWHWNAGVSLNWDVWNGGYTRAVECEKRLQLEQSLIEQEDLRRAVLLELTEAYLELTHAREIVEAGKGTVDLAERATGIVRQRYSAGLSTYLEFTDATLALNEARLSHLAAIRAHRDAVARLEYAAGMTIVPEAERGGNE